MKLFLTIVKKCKSFTNQCDSFNRETDVTCEVLLQETIQVN